MDVVMYVDGFNLYHGLHSKYGHKYLWLDLQALAQRMRLPDNIVAVRYFTAMVKGDADAARRQLEYLGALEAHSPRINIVHGRHKDRTPKPCPKCRTAWQCGCIPPRNYRKWEEKLTDVALASAMIEDAAKGLGDASILVSTDSDFHPAIEASLRLAPSRHVFIACPPGRLAQGQAFGPIVTPFLISEANLKASLLPDVVQGLAGRVYQRPQKWR